MPIRDLARITAEVLVASPRFLTAPLYRNWHLRWGQPMPRSPRRCRETSWYRRHRSTPRAPSRSRRRPRTCGRGSSRSAPGGPASTATTCSTTPRVPAPTILPQFQQTKVGDWVPMSSTVNQTTAFTVKAFQPNQWLLWAKPHSTWAWKLTQLDGGRTRLVTRLKERYAPGASPSSRTVPRKELPARWPVSGSEAAEGRREGSMASTQRHGGRWLCHGRDARPRRPEAWVAGNGGGSPVVFVSVAGGDRIVGATSWRGRWLASRWPLR
jgi:hypothetical protein